MLNFLQQEREREAKKWILNLARSAEAQFIVPDMEGGIKLTLTKACRTGPSGYISWRAGRTTLCHSRLYPPVRDYEFGYCIGIDLEVLGLITNIAKIWSDNPIIFSNSGIKKRFSQNLFNGLNLKQKILRPSKSWPKYVEEWESYEIWC